MIVCYANGGGLGHLTRIRAYLHTRPPGGEPVTILTGSPFAADPRVIGGHRVRSAPPDSTATSSAGGSGRCWPSWAPRSWSWTPFPPGCPAS